MSTFDLEERQVVEDAAGMWWVFLVTGILWMLVSIILFRFDYTSVSAISILFGIVAIFAGANEFVAMVMAQRWWKVVHIVLGLLFIGIGIVAFIHPGNTFAALAAVFSFFLILKGRSTSSCRSRPGVRSRSGGCSSSSASSSWRSASGPLRTSDVPPSFSLRGLGRSPCFAQSRRSSSPSSFVLPASASRRAEPHRSGERDHGGARGYSSAAVASATVWKTRSSPSTSSVPVRRPSEAGYRSRSSSSNRVIWSPAGAPSRAFSDRQGVTTGGAISSAPASTSAEVASSVSATSKATRMCGPPVGRPRPRR